jgi:hypothetical protein
VRGGRRVGRDARLHDAKGCVVGRISEGNAGYGPLMKTHCWASFFAFAVGLSWLRIVAFGGIIWLILLII